MCCFQHSFFLSDTVAKRVSTGGCTGGVRRVVGLGEGSFGTGFVEKWGKWSTAVNRVRPCEHETSASSFKLNAVQTMA